MISIGELPLPEYEEDILTSEVPEAVVIQLHPAIPWERADLVAADPEDFLSAPTRDRTRDRVAPCRTELGTSVMDNNRLRAMGQGLDSGRRSARRNKRETGNERTKHGNVQQGKGSSQEMLKMCRADLGGKEQGK